MSKSNLHETANLKLVFQNVNASNIGDGTGLRGSSTPGSFYVALYESDPAEDDSGTETTYGGYARQAIARSGAGFTVSGSVCSNASIITFPISTGGSSTITHFAIRTAITTGDLIGSGTVASITIETDDTPKFEIGDLTITEN